MKALLELFKQVQQDEEFDAIVSRGLQFSPIHQILVEKSVAGWKGSMTTALTTVAIRPALLAFHPVPPLVLLKTPRLVPA